MRTAFPWCNRAGREHPELPSIAAAGPSILVAHLSGRRGPPLALVTEKYAIRRGHKRPDREGTGLTSAELQRLRGPWFAIDDWSPRNCDDCPAAFAGSIVRPSPDRSAIDVNTHLLHVTSVFPDDLAFGKHLAGEDTTAGMFVL